MADARVRKKRRRNKLTKAEVREVHRGLLKPPTVASAGFADDTITITNSWEDMQRQHMWLVDFFVAHHIMLNGKKSVLVSSEVEGVATSDLSLPDIDWTTIRESWGFTVIDGGELPCKPKRHDIPVRGRDTEFRYLGLYVSLSLKWTRMVNALHFHVINAARRIRAHRLTLTQAVETLREYIFPKMELALTYARVTKQRMESWDKIIRRAITWQWNGFHVSSLSRDALYFSTDLMRICDLRRLIRATQVVNALRHENVQADEVCRYRLKLAKVKYAPVKTGGKTARLMYAATKHKYNWTSRSLVALQELKHTISARPPGHRSPSEPLR